MKYTLLGVALLAGACCAPLARGQSLHRQVWAAAGTQTPTLTFTLGEAFAYSPTNPAVPLTLGAHPGMDVITGLGAPVSAPQPALWPNPASTELRLTGTAQPEQLLLLDVLSRPVLATTLQPGTSVAIDHLPAGTYLARIGTGAAQRLQRVVVSR